MSLRETINKNSGVMTIVLLLLIAGAFWFIFQQARANFGPAPFLSVYYTADDGKTFFADERGKLPPFDHKGSQAVLAHVFSCGDEKFVAYVERYTPKAKAAIEEFVRVRDSGQQPTNLGEVMSADATGKEIKKPGGQWVNINSQAGREVMTVVCPDKSPAIRVEP